MEGPQGPDQAVSDAVERLLETARAVGLVGPGPAAQHIEHSLAFSVGMPDQSRALDLGSGAGVPGLLLAALVWPTCEWVLVDAGKRRCEFLTDGVLALGLGDRVRVCWGRAEELGRDDALRETFSLVTARGFGPAGVTAECAAPFLRVGGHLVVSEPPGGAPGRWSVEGLEQLGLVRDDEVQRPPEPALATFRAVSPCPDRYPRRVGIPAKRPLF